MDRFSNRQQMVRLVCPECGCLMEAAERDSGHGVTAMRPHIGQLQLVLRSVPVWRCTNCNIDRPRFTS